MTAIATEAPLDVGAVWRRTRLPVVIVVLAVAVAAGLAALESAPPPRPLDPRDASPAGSRAVAQLLRDRGVSVDVVAAAAAARAAVAGTTVMVPDPGSVPLADLRALAGAPADVVAVSPSFEELSALGVAAEQSGELDGETVAPGCRFGPAVVAGAARIAGDLYRVESRGDLSCYAVAGSAALVVHSRPNGARTIVFGSGSTLTNARLGEQGDAALALGLLDRYPRLAWLVPRRPTNGAPDRARKHVIDLLPDRLLWAVLQLFIVVAIAAVWRGRRLGPVVAEPLPVVVRAAETVEGRARLLRAARLRGRAADALRSASRDRLADRLGVGASAGRPGLVESVARRTGRAVVEIDALLYGAAPPDDAALVRLADDLDALERAVQQPGAAPTEVDG